MEQNTIKTEKNEFSTEKQIIPQKKSQEINIEIREAEISENISSYNENKQQQAGI